MPVNQPQRAFAGWHDEVEVAAESPTPARLDQPSIEGWQVYVIDAHSLIFQVFHALPDMASPQGEHVAAVFPSPFVVERSMYFVYASGIDGGHNVLGHAA